MKTEHYISQLLFRYQCVTVPGFGAFLSEIQSAQHIESANTFYPPKKLVSFNSNLKNNDGLLANHIAQAEKLSYEKAVEIISDDVASWKNTLVADGKLTLKNIGDLTLNSEKNLVFSPTEQTNYLKEAFGLTSFVSPVVKREIYKQEAEKFEEKAPVQFTPEKRAGRSYLKYAAVIAVALMATGTIGYKLFQDRVEQQTLVVETEVRQEVQNKIQEATFLITNPLPPVTLTVKEEKLPYHVVAGVFRSEENADKALSELRDLGFKARKISPTRQHLHPVVYGSYATHSAASQAMNEIRSTQNKDAWLLVKKQ
ncbi:MAG: SPOR domain-containing protein [Flavobacterium sp.]|nr:SPOR domain-containing protein [Flavobacterium sp.]